MSSLPAARSLLCLVAAASIGLGGAARAETLTLYSAQHQQMVDQLAADFTKLTGITVRTRYGEAPEIASQIVQEGAASPADVYFTENSPELVLLDEKGLLAPVDPTILAQVPARFSAPDGKWLGVLARENVLTYDPKLIAASALPASLMALADPAWKGKVAFAPTDADFLPLVAAVARTHGRPAALAWLKGLKANGQVFDDDEGVVAAVDRGAAATGIINNYYWARLRQEKGVATVAKIHHFGNGDVGGLINVSGAAVLKSSHDMKAAQRFLAFLVARPTQTAIGAGNVDFEYPLAPGVAANPVLEPFARLSPPKLSVIDLGDDQDSAALLREAGLL